MKNAFFRAILLLWILAFVPISLVGYFLVAPLVGVIGYVATGNGKAFYACVDASVTPLDFAVNKLRSYNS